MSEQSEPQNPVDSTSDLDQRVKAIFWELVESSTVAEDSDRRIELACQGDPALKARVQEMLNAYRRADQVLNLPPVADTSKLNSISATTSELGISESNTQRRANDEDDIIQVELGKQIGPYKILERIGVGGMGVVYLAEQHEPLRRMVALKAVKPGMDSRQVLARFDAERQALALMDHPNIAKVLDAGVADTGRPYFVMEYVKGLPITKYCDQVQMTVSERLKLFAQVCQAVQHAHQKGIIHRDLKPSNILVCLYDGKPVPKVIDFGLAKALYQPLTDLSLQTAHGLMVGTPRYMSPEQAEFNNLDVDTRSDIYSLGVVLYELLTGTTPLEKGQFQNAPIQEMLRLIKEYEPPRPSQRISSSENSASISNQRQAEPSQLSRLVRGELDWIVMRALDKERHRRYETAYGLARDIERYLANEPVEACPPSMSYRANKFLRRNKGPVLATAAVVMALLMGMIGFAWQARVIAAERNATAKQRDRALAAERHALEEGEIAKAVSEFLEEDLLGFAGAIAQIDAGFEPDPDLKLITLIDRAKDRVELRFTEQPVARAAVQSILAGSYYSLGRFDDSVALWEKVLAFFEQRSGPNDTAAMVYRDYLAAAYREAGQLDKAVELLEDLLKLRKTTLGAEHPDTLTSMYNLAQTYRLKGQFDLALPLAKEVLELMKATTGSDSSETLACMGCLASIFLDQGDLEMALSLFIETLDILKEKLGDDHPDTLIGLNNLANVYYSYGLFEQSLPLFEQVFESMKNSLGTKHSSTLTSMYNLAGIYSSLGRMDQAIPLMEETLELMTDQLGIEHPTTLQCMQGLTVAYSKVKNFDQALLLGKELVELTNAKLGPDHPLTLKCIHDLGKIHFQLGNSDQGFPLLEQAVEQMTTKLGLSHPYTLASIRDLGQAYQSAGKLDSAIELFESLLEPTKTTFGLENRETLKMMFRLGVTYRMSGQLKQAIVVLEETLKLQTDHLGFDHPDTLDTINSLAVAYDTTGQLDRAIPLFEQAFKLVRDHLGREHSLMLATMVNLASAYKDSGQWEKSLPLFEEILEIRTANFGRDHLQTIATANDIAIAHKFLGNFEMAIEILTSTLDLDPMSSPEQVSNKIYRASLLLTQVECLIEQERFDEAEPLARDVVAIRKELNADNWQYFHSLSILGECLLGQKKFADAEQLLLSGFQGIDDRHEQIGKFDILRVIEEAIMPLIQLYEQLHEVDPEAGYDAEMKNWLDRRAKIELAND